MSDNKRKCCTQLNLCVKQAFGLALGLVSRNMFKYVFGQTSIWASIQDPSNYTYHYSLRLVGVVVIQEYRPLAVKRPWLNSLVIKSDERLCIHSFSVCCSASLFSLHLEQIHQLKLNDTKTQYSRPAFLAV